MRSRAARVAIVVVGLAASGGLFVLARGGDDGPASAAPSQPQTGPRTRTRASPKPKPPPAAPWIVVRGGTPVGGVARLRYERGDLVRFALRSDVADEVHVHGYDIKKDVPAKGSVSFAFRATIEGVFDVELEHSHTRIGRLRVTP